MLSLVIYGTRGLSSTTDTGVFNCPQCGPQQHYSNKQSRVWFTLYFIPVIPLHVNANWIECSSCRGTYQPAVLNYNPEAEMREFFDKVMRVMILMGVSDGALGMKERAAIQSKFSEITGQSLSDPQLNEEESLARSANMDCASYLRILEPELGQDGKIMIVESLWEIASCEGGVTPQKQAQLEQIPSALNISAADFQQIIDNMQ